MKKFPKGIRKYIRKEKARIRREILDVSEREENLKNLYEEIKIPSIKEGDSNQTKDLKNIRPDKMKPPKKSSPQVE